MRNENMRTVEDMLSEHKNHQRLSLGLSFLQILLSVATPLLIKLLIDEITGTMVIENVMKIGIALILVNILIIIVDIVCGYVWHSLALKAGNTMRYKVFENVINKKISFFNSNTNGDITARILEDSNMIASSAVLSRNMLILNCANLIVMLTVMVVLSPQLTLVVLVFMPLYAYLFNKLNKRLRSSSLSSRENYSKTMQIIQQDIEGISTIKFFNKESFFVDKFKETLDKLLDINKRMLMLNRVGSGVTQSIVTMMPVAVLLVGTVLIINGNTTVGTLMAFYSYIGYMYEPINNLSDYNLARQQAIGMSDRVVKFINEGNEDESLETVPNTTINELEFNDVDFYYNEGENILNDFDMKIKSGDVVAISGVSGKGKTTVLKLLTKINTANSGVVNINDVNINNYTKEQLYNKISVVEQTPFIFNSTIRENILFDSNIDDEKLKNILDITGVSEFVGIDGLNEEVLEYGKNFSGGQKQRICLSRALARDFDVLILDEAFSALDQSLSVSIMGNLKEYVENENKILILVAHNEELIGMCNRIVEL